MRNLALLLGIVMIAASFGACVNDPTVDDSTMSDTDTDVVDTDTATVVDSGTETATE